MTRPDSRRRRPAPWTLCATLFGLALHLAPAGAGEPEWDGPRLVPTGPSTPLISQAERRRLGLRNGPDSIVDLWHSERGDFLVFSGAREDGTRGSFRVATDRALSHVKADGAQDLQTILTPACQRATAARAAGTCQDFDSDYAGGGTVFPCPDGRTLYFYHGENHTDPSGRLHQGPEQGWTGIGVAQWDERAQRFVRRGQVLGMALPNDWQGDGDQRRTRQGPPISGNPSAVLSPDGQDLYLLFADRTDDAEAVAAPARCDTRTCTALARASVRDVCASAGRPVSDAWRILHRGRFDSPALVRATPGKPGQTGGDFTPLQDRWRNLGETTPNVTWLPTKRLFVQAAVANDGRVLLRQSKDMLRWSQPDALNLVAPANKRFMYARLLSARCPDELVLTLVERDASGWQDAQLLRVPLGFVGAAPPTCGGQR